jgi:dihydroxyacetone kinase-like protein
VSRILNSPETYADDLLEGLRDFSPTLRRDADVPRAIYRQHSANQSKVGIASGGGSGHLPLFVGYVGEGLLDSCAVGNIFEGPTEEACAAAIRRADFGQRVLCLLGNYGGDRMNFAMACDELEGEIETRTVLVRDDPASAAPENRESRRGVAGMVLVYKEAGATATAVGNLGEVVAAAQHAELRIRTIGAAFGGLELPGSQERAIDISDGDIEMGMGIHGEPGLWRQKLPDAVGLAHEMAGRLLAETPDGGGNEVALGINGLGATPLEDLLVLYRSVKRELDSHSISVPVRFVGPLVTSLDMAGVSIILMWLDSSLKSALSAPASSVFGGQQL